MNDVEESIVHIDEHNLDKECIKLPTDYLRAAHQSAEYKRDLDELEAELKVVQSEMGMKVRDHPARFGLEKVTETALPSVVITTKEYQDKLREVQRARHQAELAQAVVWALEHKKRTLTLLVELHGMGYFSNPKVSERGREAVEEMTKTKVRRPRWKDDE